MNENTNNCQTWLSLNYECIKRNKLTKNEIINSNFSNNFIIIPFENFVLDPDPYMKKIESKLEKNQKKLLNQIYWR